MAVKQVSVFIENKTGKMAEVVGQIADASINIRAMSVADTGDFGILRLILSDPDKAKDIIAKDTLVKENDVVAVKMHDREGALYGILKALGEEGINVDYAYASLSPKEHGAFGIFRVNDIGAAEAVLTKNGFELVHDHDLD